MKDNNSTINGKLKTGSYSAYASHLKSFNTAVGGVFAISVTNEPDWAPDYESMNNTAAEIGNFISQQGANCGTAIMGPEPLGMNKTFITTCNSAAGANLKYICGHIYGTTPYNLGLGKEVWMTEHYVDSSISGNDWPTAMKEAKEIHDCMNAGWSMYVWWYIRRSYGLIDESGNITKNGYVMAHFSKFVRPGYSKISCPANPTTGVYVTAYKSGSSVVIVAVNQNSSDTYQDFSINGLTVTGFNRYKTTSGSNLAADSITVSGNSFGVTLPANSITTLKSK
jgi:glucuronoarabinoxylan endo-1,4-beta-xylanase